MTIFTPVARIPVIYHADEETDKKLKAVTPKTGERYFPDQSDADQIAAQTKILDEFANERCLMFVEVDGHMSLLLHAVFAYYPLGELLKYHVKLLYDNETTCEQAKTPIIRGDNRATYNLGGYLNYRAVFGWGLWAFPVPTPVTDGMHFHIRYSDDHYGEKYEVVPRNEISQEKEAANNNNTKTDEMSRKRGEGDVP
uniref:Uncharacterized protein n=1 Tax=Panagrolaimus sp. JU765 TaxID=591449 RepID=A0AC34QEW3_9BILA